MSSLKRGLRRKAELRTRFRKCDSLSDVSSEKKGRESRATKPTSSNESRYTRKGRGGKEHRLAGRGIISLSAAKKKGRRGGSTQGEGFR